MGERIKAKKLDLLNGPIWNKIPQFALPVAATGILEQLFNASDIAIVGNFASTDRTVAIAAVGANSPIIGMILNLFIGISLGTNVVIANAIGRRDDIRIYLVGMPVIFLYNFEAAIFRSVGDTKVPLQALALSGMLNVVLNLFFVVLVGRSVDGVAIATVISNAVSALILFFRLLRTDKWIRLQPTKLRISGECLGQILRIGLPAGIQSSVFNLANIVIQSAINSLGTLVIAASSAAYNIEILVYYMFNSFSQACTTFVGQNYGAGQIRRCRRTLLLCLLEDCVVSIFSIIVILSSGRFLLSLFNSDPQVIELGYTRLVLIFIAYLFSMLYEVMSGYLRGFGISTVPAILTILGVCSVRIAWVYAVFPKDRTFHTIMMAYPASLAITAVLIFIALMIYRPSRRYKELEK